ncbi:phosphoribosylaminoimidazole-succinocarboxamide synthase [Salmonella enterica subsp. arizonae]|uniref:Phosphoribosylaminoimidazole-succinocarboxamide synthase n=1 Tax=Salmonella enterica subsp. arizonae TaxID=59203 RepID=A0A379SRS7_SALER|nr:phosphoribosylaminoimidazole-succinocarboxamide synthase [Salmonella enterica subsp. arizonae]
MQKQAELYRGKAKTVYSTENPDLFGARIPQ